MTLSSDNENRTRSDRPVRALTPGRIVALALVALAARSASRTSASHRTPAGLRAQGAHAGQLILEAVPLRTENGSYAADCGTLVVPENRADPRSRLIALPVTRILARSAHPGTPVFRLEGGPGKRTCSSRRRAGSPTARRRAGRLPRRRRLRRCSTARRSCRP